jgi:hypothetical protein
MGFGKSGWRTFGVIAACLAVSACSSTSPEEGMGSSMLRALYYGGAARPSVPAADPSDVACPAVSIAPGGAAINSYAGGRAGGPEALRNQLSIVNVARECRGRPDGSIVVKVGVEGRALIGPGGSAGRLEAPVRFAIKRDERVLVSTTRRANVALTAGEMQGSFLVVEESLVVPAGMTDFEIEVGLGGSGATERPARRARR